MSQRFEIRSTDQVDPNEVVLPDALPKKFGNFEYKEIPLTYHDEDVVIKTPKLFTFGIKVEDLAYTSYTISLRIDDRKQGDRKKAFVKMLCGIVRKCEKSKRVIMAGSPLRFLCTPSSFGDGLNPYVTYYVYARVPKICDLHVVTSAGLTRIQITDLIGKWGSIRCVLKFRCITISAKGATLKVDLLGAIVEDLEDPIYNVVNALTDFAAPGSSDEDADDPDGP